MSNKKLYALTDDTVMRLERYARAEASVASNYAADDLVPLDREDSVERMARALAELEPGEPWPTNAELGGGPAGDRDVEYHQGLLQEARAALDALLQEDK